MFNGPEGSEALAGMVSGYIVTDDVLLAHVRAEVQVSQPPPRTRSCPRVCRLPPVCPSRPPSRRVWSRLSLSLP